MTEIICAGFGGQGILTAGMLMIHAGMEQGHNVTFYPSYGSEMRGGTANCNVKISEKLIASPLCKEADIVLGMTSPAVDKFEARLKPGGMLFVNASIVDADRSYRDDITVVKVPVTEISIEAGNPKGANIVMLGALASKSDLFDAAHLKEVIVKFFEDQGKGKHNATNIVCFDRGVEGK